MCDLRPILEAEIPDCEITHWSYKCKLHWDERYKELKAQWDAHFQRQYEHPSLPKDRTKYPQCEDHNPVFECYLCYTAGARIRGR